MNLNIDGQSYAFDVPDACPLCNRYIEPEHIATNARRANGQERLQVIWRCPNGACQRAFIATYEPMPNTRTREYRMTSLAPRWCVPPTIPPEVEEVSPSYKALLTQAKEAEASGLDQIAGMGYRKGLEFLLKDFVIRNREKGEVDEIKRLLLGQVITRYIPDGKLKECGKRASWLGNDETHYERRWEGRDLQDLKNLLRLTETWISSELQTEAYLRDCRTGRKRSVLRAKRSEIYV